MRFGGYRWIGPAFAFPEIQLFRFPGVWTPAFWCGGRSTSQFQKRRTAIRVALAFCARMFQAVLPRQTWLGLFDTYILVKALSAFEAFVWLVSGVGFVDSALTRAVREYFFGSLCGKVQIQDVDGNAIEQVRAWSKSKVQFRFGDVGFQWEMLIRRLCMNQWLP